jgi:small ligand-binding sensory domain FIST
LPFGAAVSVHPVSSHATGEVIGQVIEEIGAHPDAAILLVSPGHAGALEDVARTVRRLLAPSVLIGAAVPAVIGQGADDEGGAGMALWAGVVGPVRALSPTLTSLASDGFDASGLVVLSSSRVPDGVGERVAGRTAGAAGLTGPLVVGEHTLVGGTVGIAFGRGVGFKVVTAQGWRTLGPTLVVTESDPTRGLVLGLDGIPALDRLRRLAADEVPAEEVPRINRQLGIALVDADVAAVASGRGGDPSMVQRVVGADRANGAMAAGPLPDGATVRFCVRADPAADLARVLAGQVADAALVFAADPRRRGYAAADVAHDAEVVSDRLGLSQLAGAVAPLQLGPGGNFDAAAAVALFVDR